MAASEGQLGALAPLAPLAQDAGRYLAQFSHGVYDHVSEQLKSQAAAALPAIARQYLQAHAQRGDCVSRPVHYDPSADWFELDPVKIELNEEEDGWAVLSPDNQKLAAMAVGTGLPKQPNNSEHHSVATLAVMGLGRHSAGLLMMPLSAGVSALTVGWSAAELSAGLVLRAAGLGPRPAYPSVGTPPWDRFMEESVRAGDGTSWQFRVWLPFEETLEWRGETAPKPPVIVLLHGYRECGWDNFWQTQSGLGTLLQDWDFAWKKMPAIVVFPQLPRKEWGLRWWQGWTDATAQEAVMAMLWKTLSRYGGDSSRVYLIGESLGGEGAWHLAQRFPGAFAAVAASCGSLEPYDWETWEWGSDEEIYAKVAASAKAPFWFCHGTEDPYVPIEHPEKLAAALTAARARSFWPLRWCSKRGEVVFKKYEAMGHEVWNYAYEEDDMFDWLFKQRL